MPYRYPLNAGIIIVLLEYYTYISRSIVSRSQKVMKNKNSADVLRFRCKLKRGLLLFGRSFKMLFRKHYYYYYYYYSTALQLMKSPGLHFLSLIHI